MTIRIGLVLLWLLSSPAQARSPAPPLGKVIGFDFIALDGRPINAQALRGKVVLLQFWGTWCAPCVRELPFLRAAYEKFNSQGLEIVGIAYERQKETLSYFVRREQISWPQNFDGLGMENKLGVRLGVKQLPALWVLDRTGVLRAALPDAQSLEAALTPWLRHSTD